MFGSRDKLKARLPPRVPDGERVYAVGDIHGRADLLAQLQEQILADAAGRPPARQTIVYLGDYVDRGPQSPVVIDRLIDAPLAGFASIHLLGNHEDIMLRFHDGDVSVAASWLQYGGRQTLASYGIECDRLPALGVLRQRMAHGVPARHFEFMRALRHDEIDREHVGRVPFPRQFLAVGGDEKTHEIGDRPGGRMFALDPFGKTQRDRAASNGNGQT